MNTATTHNPSIPLGSGEFRLVLASGAKEDIFALELTKANMEELTMRH